MFTTSTLLPAFLERLARPEIRRVLVAGCGGGFDFVHGMLLYPELMRLGKEVILGSYSFGDPARIGGEAPVVFREGGVIARRATATSVGDAAYAPEVHLCSFLDVRFPEAAPHGIYAYYARDFTVPALTRFYQQLVRAHAIDAVVVIDGGSDSLMRGDEEGLGDPIEDCVSVATVAALGIEAFLITIGLGADRYNQVSDASSLRAIAELTAAGGFLGAVALAPENAAFRFYRDCIDHIDARHGFRSVMAGAVLAAGEGGYGVGAIPPRLASRIRGATLHLWPLMPVLWGFDPIRVVERSLMAEWIRHCETVSECYDAVVAGRAQLGASLRGVEELPRHADARGPQNPWRP